MKIIHISKRGVSSVKAKAVKAPSGGEYYSLHHGEKGRGRYEYRLPLGARDFPSPADHGDTFEMTGDYTLISLRRNDSAGNPLYLVANGDRDGQYLVLWDLDPGYRGSADYTVEGMAEVIAKGHEAQGAAGRSGGADCPVVLVSGPCRLKWVRSGRVYGEPRDFIAEFDGETWTVSSDDECAISEAALNY